MSDDTTLGALRDAVCRGVQTVGRVTARGFGTYADGAEGRQVIDTTGLGDVVRYDPADLTVTVQAGCPMNVLADRLAEHRQWLPVDVPWPERTTVGGLVATGMSGPLRASYGTVRDHVIGLGWIGGDGAELASGGQVVKNVAGYDLMKMHVGARGRFGVVTQVTFKLRPRPECEGVWGWDASDGAAAAAAIRALRDHAHVTWGALRRADGSDHWTAMVGVLGSAELVAAATESVSGAATGVRGPSMGAAQRLMITRDAWSPALRGARRTVRPTDIDAIVSSATGAAIADVLAGVVWSDREETDEPAPTAAANLLDGVVDALDPTGVFR